ncbi:hypothetical protein DAEQUDRAFT_306563 [Daedalea quercina L-15889]|uniref:Uncharacterized protein n=1 Tax=Daedalea quercina L-15889 TaxID=1314783 RepID=A0A165Q2E3_9APHY|nr:hypothetical protein DAEQUDRAFT_306563 [Daedalea quercina L-15889]
MWLAFRSPAAGTCAIPVFCTYARSLSIRSLLQMFVLSRESTCKPDPSTSPSPLPSPTYARSPSASTATSTLLSPRLHARISSPASYRAPPTIDTASPPHLHAYIYRPAYIRIYTHPMHSRTDRVSLPSPPPSSRLAVTGPPRVHSRCHECMRSTTPHRIP